MVTPLTLLFIFIGASIALALLIAFRPALTRARSGKILAFLAIFIFPVVAAVGGAEAHLERSKQTQFCLSCHVMADYGKSLTVDDPTYLAAAHFQNNRVPRDSACYTCHTDYALYGGIRAKVRGLKHVYVQYFSTPASPIKLYTAFNNRECLHCHEGARSFEEGAVHTADPETLPMIKANKLSCTSSGCHEVVHNVQHLKDVKLWTPLKQ
jgi:cytochrome c-type protein NapC